MLFNTALVAASAATLVSAAAIDRRAAITDFNKSPARFSYPKGREGWTTENASKAPCGGRPIGDRAQYPLTGGKISLTQGAPLDNVNLMYYKGDNPTKFHSFQSYTNQVNDLGAGHYCTEGPDFASLGFSAGDKATLMILYQLDNEKGVYYECADIDLVAATAYTAPSMVCGNYTNEIEVSSTSGPSLDVADDAHAQAGSGPTGSALDAASASGASTQSSSGLSTTEAGGVGAGVALGVVGVALGALWATGLLHFGKKKRAVELDTASITSSENLKAERQ